MSSPSSQTLQADKSLSEEGKREKHEDYSIEVRLGENTRPEKKILPPNII